MTYKTAWRMFNLIRNRLMTQDYNGPLSGQVEADETFVGGKLRESERRKLRAQGIVNRGPATKPRAVVMGVVQRGGGVHATVIPTRSSYHARYTVREHVLPGSIVYTDDWGGYDKLGKSPKFTHRRINHSEKVYVSGDVHTQTIEGFFSLVKNGIRGVYHSVSTKWLQGYLNEYAWRYNHRDDPQAMFWRLLRRSAMAS